ncbi:MAG: hypothetical protein CVT66_10575 [Actinobacteria bacterium HGW-Actinobacteria-6]|jgi:hypothetical protein|nr:MAG: hypothetical protein CVT66_10575 [Actinobacteria bacterium HGW-Actinobacteria-6]
MAKSNESVSCLEFKTLEEFRKHYFPKAAARQDDERDIRVAAEQLAARTIRAVRRQLSAS